MVPLDDVRRFFEAHVASGLTLAAFARQQGVRPQQAYGWRQRIRRRAVGDCDSGMPSTHFRELLSDAESGRLSAGSDHALDLGNAGMVVIDVPAWGCRLSLRNVEAVPLAASLLARLRRQPLAVGEA